MEILNLIAKAIKNCDNIEAKSHLVRALDIIKTQQKKVVKKNQSMIFADEAKKRNEKWNEMISKNLKLRDNYDEERND